MKVAVNANGFSLSRLQERVRRLEQAIHDTLVATDARRGTFSTSVLTPRVLPRDAVNPVRTSGHE
jgi:hypothetical protein